MAREKYRRPVSSTTRPEAVTLALDGIGGAEAAQDTEDVALRVSELFPGMFAWRKYREHIDIELVRVALNDATKKKGWVVGSHRQGGWLLTPAGVLQAQRLRAQLPDAPATHQRGKDEQLRERERGRLLATSAFARVSAGDAASVTADEADSFFRMNVYVEGSARERRIARLQNLFGSDPELGPVVAALAARARQRS